MEQRQPSMSSPFSSDSPNRRLQSQWLRSTLADLDEKIKTILELVEDNGDTFAMRVEMYYRKRPQLIKMVKDLHKAYSSLAEKYDHLKSSSSNGSLSNSLRALKGKTLLIEEFVSIEPPDFSSEDDEFESPKNFMSIDDPSNDKDGNFFDFCIQECDANGWNRRYATLSELMEETLSTQDELIRSNEEKREVINELRNENMILSQRHNTMRSWKRQLRRLICFT